MRAAMDENSKHAIRSAVAGIDLALELLGNKATTREQLAGTLRVIRESLAALGVPVVRTADGGTMLAAEAPSTSPAPGAGQRARVGHLQKSMDFFAPPSSQAEPSAKGDLTAEAPGAGSSAAPNTPRASSILPLLSKQQRNGIERGRDCPLFKAEARAGSGKTTFLVGFAEAAGGSGLYLAYNRDIRTNAAGRFPSHVVVGNWHSLAYGCEAAAFKKAGKPIREWRPTEIMQALDLPASENRQAYAARETLAAFLNSTDVRVGPDHVPAQIAQGMHRRLRGSGGGISPDLSLEMLAQLQKVADQAQALWELSKDLSTKWPISHDGYLRLWHDKGPELDADYLLLDEAQDFTRVMRSVALSQKARRIFVGDRWQQLYSYRGAVNAMQSITAESCALTESYRFGSAIAEVANSILTVHGEAELVRGVAKHDSRVGAIDAERPYAVLSRTNAGVCVRAAALAARVPTAITGDVREIVDLMQSALALFTMKPAEVVHPLLRAFDSYRALEEYVEQTGDRECALMVKLLSEHGASLKQIIATLRNNLVSPDTAHVVLSTVHRAKGLEWNQVVLDEDFQDIYTVNGDVRVDEANILYVAATRARRVLQPNSVLLQVMQGKSGTRYPRAKQAGAPGIRYPTRYPKK